MSADALASTRLTTGRDGYAEEVFRLLSLWRGDRGGSRRARVFFRLQCYPTTAVDAVDVKFTGKERDEVTGLDYFNARYYSPAQGRFVSPDPGNAGADPSNPQTWNGYAYVGNNPLNFTDPGGESWFSIFAGVVAGVAAMNPGFGLAVAGTFNTFESVVSGHPPGFGLPGASDFTGCGGPFGSCGTIGGVWTEESGTGVHVQDPDRFISDLQGAARIQCAADFGSNHSIAAGLEALFPGIKSNVLANFGVGMFGGNTVSGLTNLGLYIGGQKTPAPSDLVRISFKGVGQGIPLPPGPSSQGRTVWSGATSYARKQVLQAATTAAYNGVRGAGAQTLQLGISNTVRTSVAGLSASAAANVASGAGYVKFAWDLGTFAVGFAKCEN